MIIALMNDCAQIRHAFDELFAETIQFREYLFISIQNTVVSLFFTHLMHRPELEIYFVNTQML